MESRELQDQLFRLSLISLTHALQELSQDCDRIKKQGAVSPRQIRHVLALHDHLMQTVYNTLIRFMSENPALAAEVHERLHALALARLLHGTGVNLNVEEN